MRFIRYQHIEKWGSPLVEGITNGEISVFPKLDGKCTSIFNDAGRLAIGGRKCEENRQDSPHVFRHFEGTDKYRLFTEENPDLALYGEFGNKTTIGYYNAEVYGDFFVFDVVSYDGEDRPAYMTYEEYVPLLEKYGIKYIPRIAVVETGLFSEDLFDNLIELATEHYVNKELARGKKAEGFILKNYEYHNRHGRQIWAKVITDEYKARKHRLKADGSVDDRNCSQILVDETFTSAFIEKELQKFREICGELTKKDIPNMFDFLFSTWVTEEILNMFKVMRKYKKDDFNPGELHTLMKLKVKEHIPELFKKE